MKLSALARRGVPLALALVCCAPAFAAPSDLTVSGFRYQQHNLVSDGAVPADHVDPNLVNPWGIAFNPFAAVWVSDNGTGLSTLYDGAGVPQSLVVQIPTPDADGGGNPTGVVYSGSSTDFSVSKNGLSGPSRFLFATEDGVIAGWAPNVDSTHAIRVIDNSSYHAIYKGIEITGAGNGAMLYATDFHNAKVD
ncbi:MAG: TIGR03118 family protein, partial [Proteobacteria bacterium]|nr:TIGR03118 family protein [Pseudomonadota bacterium]